MARPRRLSEEQAAAARAYYRGGATVDETAERFGVGRTVMLRVLKGITRPAGGQRKVRVGA